LCCAPEVTTKIAKNGREGSKGLGGFFVRGAGLIWIKKKNLDLAPKSLRNLELGRRISGLIWLNPWV
jgi:hypothetical protein